MTIKSLTGRQCSNRHIARLLGVSEGTVRYHRRRQAGGTVDGRTGQQPVAARFHEAIDAYVSSSGEESPSNVAALHAWLVAEHDYPAGLRSVQRYVRRAYPEPARRARRRVETPPGVQAQADWASFPGVWVGGTRRDLLAFEGRAYLVPFALVDRPVEVRSCARHVQILAGDDIVAAHLRATAHPNERSPHHARQLGDRTNLMTPATARVGRPLW